MKAQEIKETIIRFEKELLNAKGDRKSNIKTYIKNLKAELKGNFITVEDLKEFKSLIIWNINNCSYGVNITKEVMTEMLSKVNDKKVFFVTKRGIKGVLTTLAVRTSLRLAEEKLRTNLGLSELVNYSENTELSNFLQFRLNKIK
tara:strand:- start:2704 stop:3138 length:435 start_codon:yes stop_codon:yes gene_type:complete